jgi:hypothetical protein
MVEKGSTEKNTAVIIKQIKMKSKKRIAIFY